MCFPRRPMTVEKFCDPRLDASDQLFVFVEACRLCPTRLKRIPQRPHSSRPPRPRIMIAKSIE